MVLAWSVFIGGWVRIIQDRSGVRPRLQGMPKPLLRELVQFWAVGAAVAGAVVALGLAVSFVVAGTLAAVIAVAGGRYGDRRYQRRAEALVAAQRSSTHS